ncbi:hypothetical protein ABLE91_14725 [Aquabacter sp. CN5-332]|uniref:hypothetical protein n=1 Tax=Aquabacter sp. CN5-332 TaxID=3156608 RepID=UPI0032B58941
MCGGSAPDAEADAAEFAAYVASLTAELSKLARDHKLTTLAYLLEITRLEARSVTETEEGVSRRGR